MAKTNSKPRPREIGRTKPEKKHIIDPRYRNLFWTIVFLLVLLFFFIVNNTGNSDGSGPHPPGYDAEKQQSEIKKDVPSQVKIKI